MTLIQLLRLVISDAESFISAAHAAPWFMNMPIHMRFAYPTWRYAYRTALRHHCKSNGLALTRQAIIYLITERHYFPCRHDRVYQRSKKGR